MQVTPDRIGQRALFWVDAPTFEVAQLRSRALADSLETHEVRFGRLNVHESPKLRPVMAERLGQPNFYAFSAKAIAA